MQTLADGLRSTHPNPFWRQPEAEFDAEVAAAPAHLATLSDSDARAEVMRLTAGIDGHTGVYLSEAGFHLYALHLYRFGDDVDVIAATDPALVGAQVVRIGGTPIAAAVDAVAPYSPFDNAATIELVVPTLLVTPEVLHAAGVVDDIDAPAFVVRLADGTERTIDPEQLTWDEYTTQVDPRPIGMTKLASLPALARIDEAFWTTVLDDTPAAGGPTLYMQYNQVVRQSGSTSIDQMAEEIEVMLDAGDIARGWSSTCVTTRVATTVPTPRCSACSPRTPSSSSRSRWSCSSDDRRSPQGCCSQPSCSSRRRRADR